MKALLYTLGIGLWLVAFTVVIVAWLLSSAVKVLVPTWDVTKL